MPPALRWACPVGASAPADLPRAPCRTPAACTHGPGWTPRRRRTPATCATCTGGTVSDRAGRPARCGAGAAASRPRRGPRFVLGRAQRRARGAPRRRDTSPADRPVKGTARIRFRPRKIRRGAGRTGWRGVMSPGPAGAHDPRARATRDTSGHEPPRVRPRDPWSRATSGRDAPQIDERAPRPIEHGRGPGHGAGLPHRTTAPARRGPRPRPRARRSAPGRTGSIAAPRARRSCGGSRPPRSARAPAVPRR